MSGLQAAVTGAMAAAVVSTIGDFIWATWIPQHRPVYGLTHGTLLFLAIGFVLGATAGRAAAGALGGAAIGALAAGSFYLLAPLTGYSAMFVVWVAVWVALGALTGWLHGVAAPGAAVRRGALAALLSGAAFYAISGIWFPFDPRGWDYAVHFGAWTLAYLPGFGALLIVRR